MKHIIIRNLGPLKNADVELKSINVIIGPQSSGKSCLLKIASYCTWVEKRIQLSQSPETFAETDSFLKNLTTFHNLNGYIKADTYIEYETDAMKFSYDHSSKLFSFSWKDGRWQYNTPKVSYIPAERNMVAVIPNWFEVKMGDDNVRSFMADWQKARLAQKEDLPILNLGVSYHYDARSNSDKIVIDGGQSLDFTNTSSGLQSLIPLYVHLDYLTTKRFTSEEDSVAGQTENEELLKSIHRELFTTDGKAIETTSSVERSEDGRMKLRATITFRKIGNIHLAFQNREKGVQCEEIYKNFTQRLGNEIFIEEPEQNLFPPTQAILVEQLQECIDGEHKGRLFIATHSPYVVTAFLEREREDFALFVVSDDEDGNFSVKTASEADIQQAYDYSIDLFHNIRTLGQQ